MLKKLWKHAIYMGCLLENDHSNTVLTAYPFTYFQNNQTLKSGDAPTPDLSTLKAYPTPG